MLTNALEIVERYCRSGEKIGIAVSGGSDSMCLAHLVLNNKNIDKKNVVIINIDHMIRGEESVLDSRFVAAFCAKNGVKLCYKAFDVPYIAVERGEGVEVVARNVRKEYFNEIIALEKLKYVFLAHNKSDQAETILLHCFRGSGLNGLCGMSEKDGVIVRPLINTSKSDILDYLSRHKVEFVTDSTNLNSDYSRNYIRNELFPMINKKFPSAEDALVKLSKIAASDEQFIESCVDEKKIKKHGDKIVSLDSSALKTCSSLAVRYIMLALKQINEDLDIESKNLELICGLVKAQNGSRLDIKGDLIAIKEYNEITFVGGLDDSAVNFKTSLFELPFSELLSKKQVTFGGYKIMVSEVGKPVFEGDNNFFSGEATRSKRLYFDVNKLPKSAVLRFRRDGDIFVPFSGDKKKLKKYLIDKKIPLRIRDKIPCVCYNNNTYLVLGVEISKSIAVEMGRSGGSIMAIWCERY